MPTTAAPHPSPTSPHPQLPPPTTREINSTTSNANDSRPQRTTGSLRCIHSPKCNPMIEMNKLTPDTTTIRVVLPHTKNPKLQIKLSSSAGSRAPRRDAAPNTGDNSPSCASWKRMRGVLQTLVADPNKQLAATSNVTMAGAASPQKGWAATRKLPYKLPSKPGSVANCNSTKLPPTNTRGMNEATQDSALRVSFGCTLSATKDEAVSQP